MILSFSFSLQPLFFLLLFFMGHGCHYHSANDGNHLDDSWYGAHVQQKLFSTASECCQSIFNGRHCTVLDSCAVPPTSPYPTKQSIPTKRPTLRPITPANDDAGGISRPTTPRPIVTPWPVWTANDGAPPPTPPYNSGSGPCGNGNRGDGVCSDGACCSPVRNTQRCFGIFCHVMYWILTKTACYSF